MATNKTPNLQLNQWVHTDPVRMEDFNADNAKIDAAVHAAQTAADAALAANSWVKLIDVTLAVDNVKTVELKLSDLNMSEYLSFRVYFSPHNSSRTHYRINKAAGSYARYDLGNWTSSAYSACFIDSSMFEVDPHASGYIYASGFFDRFRISKSYSGSKLNTIDMMVDDLGNNIFPIGTRFVVLGVKV